MQTAQPGRLPLGTPTQHPHSASHSHSHIQIVPREEPQIGYYEDNTPIYRSNSLQFSGLPLSDQESRRGSVQHAVSTQHTTFAQMARRCNRSEIENNGSPNSGPVTLPGYITLQSNRNRKGNKTWRPLQPSDLGTGEGTGDFYTDSSSSPVDSPGASSLEKSNSRPSKPISQRSPVIDKPMDNRTIISRAQTSSAPCEEALPVGLLREQQPVSKLIANVHSTVAHYNHF